MSGDKASVDVARLRGLLLQGADAVREAAQSLDRALAALEASYPQQLGAALDSVQAVGDHLDDPDDERLTYDDLAHGATVLAALQPGRAGDH